MLLLFLNRARALHSSAVGLVVVESELHNLWCHPPPLLLGLIRTATTLSIIVYDLTKDVVEPLRVDDRPVAADDVQDVTQAGLGSRAVRVETNFPHGLVDVLSGVGERNDVGQVQFKVAPIAEERDSAHTDPGPLFALVKEAHGSAEILAGYHQRGATDSEHTEEAC